jgi:hypothetical protein
VGGALLVHQVEALESQDSKAPAREVEQRGAPHPAETEYDHIVCRHDASSITPPMLRRCIELEKP